MEYLPLIWFVGGLLTLSSLILGLRRLALLICLLATTAMVAQLVVGEEIKSVVIEIKFWMVTVIWTLLTLRLALDLPAVKRAVGKVKLGKVKR